MTNLESNPVAPSPASTVGKVVKSEAEWRAQLTPMEYRVLRQAGLIRGENRGKRLIRIAPDPPA